MKTFILENWRLILDIISMIIVVVFFFIRKKPIEVHDTLIEIIYSRLPEWINIAEEVGKRNHLTSNEKLALVVSYAKNYFELNGFTFFLRYEAIVRSAVEEFLSTPQKKGE